MQQLKNGEIDLLCTAQYSDERARVYDYSAYPIGYTQGALRSAARHLRIMMVLLCLQALALMHIILFLIKIIHT